ncbi:MAG TPA: prenyltransferase [Halanaerobiales bacterium]|nr:prenyltransferase [Halanaerobiales bacterium]
MKKIKILKEIWIASRPLSLSLALYSTTLGIVIANRELDIMLNHNNILLIFLVTLAGLIVQTGTNFINDYFECEYKNLHFTGKKYNFLGQKRTWFDILIFCLGITCFLITGLLGLILIYLSTKKLIIIGIIGIIGGYSYTGEPIVYKKRGLGTPFSFVLMGPLMVLGSFLVFTEYFSVRPILLGLPVSLLIPVLMLSNELRDYKRDKGLNIKTLTVRIGFKKGKLLYLTLIILSYLLTIIFVINGDFPVYSLFTFLTIPLTVKAYKNVSEAKNTGVPITNQLHLSFGLIQIITLLFF